MTYRRFSQDDIEGLREIVETDGWRVFKKFVGEFMYNLKEALVTLDYYDHGIQDDGKVVPKGPLERRFAYHKGQVAAITKLFNELDRQIQRKT
jgi:hypothetical protein